MGILKFTLIVFSVVICSFKYHQYKEMLCPKYLQVFQTRLATTFKPHKAAILWMLADE